MGGKKDRKRRGKRIESVRAGTSERIAKMI
jgi:hypothetical protein